MVVSILCPQHPPMSHSVLWHIVNLGTFDLMGQILFGSVCTCVYGPVWTCVDLCVAVGTCVEVNLILCYLLCCASVP